MKHLSQNYWFVKGRGEVGSNSKMSSLKRLRGSLCSEMIPEHRLGKNKMPKPKLPWAVEYNNYGGNGRCVPYIEYLTINRHEFGDNGIIPLCEYYQGEDDVFAREERDLEGKIPFTINNLDA